MSKNYEFVIDGHPSIYQEKNRQLKIYFSEPDKGVNQETGIIVLIPGFGGNANSKVYKKMRSVFADAHNLVTIQCDYFGWEFMQSNFNVSQLQFDPDDLKKIFSPTELNELLESGLINCNKLLDISRTKKCIVNCCFPLKEDLTNFSDMGIMQAIDNITAVLIVMDILKLNRLNFNSGKIVAYGHSHGAYLAYMCNALAPFLFSHIIDNSAWLKPEYIFDNRTGTADIDDVEFKINFEYLARKVPYDIEMIYLPLLYEKFKNKSLIISYHGTADKLVSPLEKRNFCNKIDNCMYNEITINDVDGEMIKSTDHGLNANLLKLFDHAYKSIEGTVTKTIEIKPESTRYKTDKFIYEFDYSHGRPLVTILNS